MKLLILCTILLSTSSLVLASPFGFKKGKLELFGEGSFVKTSRNYNDDGVLYQLPGINQLQEVNGLVAAGYDFGSNWGLRAETNFRQLAAQSNTIYTYNMTTVGISDVTLASDFFVGEYYKFKFIPDMSVRIPVAGNPGDGAVTFLNDGATLVSGKIYVSRDFWILNNAVYGGFNWRSQGYSSQIPLGLITRANIKRWLFIDLKAFGEFSMNNDQYTTTPSTRNTKIIQYNGGSLLYAGVNPSFFSIKAALGFNLFSSWSLSAGLQQSIMGIRSPDETRFFVNLKFSSSSIGSPSKPKFQSDDHDQFEVDTEE